VIDECWWFVIGRMAMQGSMCRECFSSAGGVGKEGCKVPVRGGKSVAEVFERKEGRRRPGVGVYVTGDEVDQGCRLWGVVGRCTCCAEGFRVGGGSCDGCGQTLPVTSGGGGSISGVPLEGGWGRDVFCSVSGRSSSMKGSVVEMVVGDGGCCWCAAGACWLV
jgi:hypothetical protein